MATISSISSLGPVDPESIPTTREEEKSAPWIVRKIVGSMTGRIVMSSYETLRAAGTSVVCLSPWGDSSPLLLPCIRFRDLAVHTIIATTGGIAAVAAPVMGPVSDVVVGSLGDTILVEMGLRGGFALGTKATNDLVFDKSLKKMIPIHSKRLETTGVKILLITLQHKSTMTDAALGFYRSSLHPDPSLFSTVKDYLAVEKGWFSPYLFASARRPIIPRSMKPDIIFCHGPFLAGDYRIGETLLAESASVISLCNPPPPEVAEKTLPNEDHISLKSLSALSISNIFSRSRTPSPEPELTPLPQLPIPRRMVILVVGLKPHRKLWSLSARPGESVINYLLLDGCPAIVVPVKVGSPLVAWDGLTLRQLWEVPLPGNEEERSASGKFEGIVDALFEYLDLCIDWERIKIPVVDSDGGSDSELSIPLEETSDGSDNLNHYKNAAKNAVTLVVAAAIRSKSCEVNEEIDGNRSGIGMWRIP